MGGVLSTFYISNSANLVIKNNVFYNNMGDFGSALNFEHRGGSALVVDNLFDLNSNPTHPTGGGIIKASGDYGTQVISMRNIFQNNTSFGCGFFASYHSNITDINSTYYSLENK